MVKYIKFSIFLLVLMSPLMLAAPGLAENYSAIRNDYLELSRSAQLQRQRANWERIISRFERYIATTPQSSYLDKASYLLAKTWDGLGQASGSIADAQTAVQHYQSMADRFPDSYLADDALYFAGQIAENRLEDSRMAYRLYSRIVSEIPTGDMTARARERLAELPRPQGVPSQEAEQLQYSNERRVGSAPRLEKVRYWSGPEYTRIVLDLTAPVVARPNFLKGDNPRLYFDLLYTELADGMPAEILVRNGLVRQVRVSRFDEQRSRVVLDLDHVTEYEMITLKNPHRLVIDVKGPPTKPALVAADTGAGHEQSAFDDSISLILNEQKDNTPILHVPQDQRDEGIHLIVVDAGHGGKDPGAIGPNNVYEKDVTLKMAKELADTLRRRLGVKVLLTRSDDRFLELRERTAYANRVGADLFISLHANASAKKNAYGVETYFLNLSKNNQAAEVAARENGTSLQEVGNLEAILFDLMANAKINESSRLAAEVQQALISGLKPHYSRIRDLGVKQGPFHVLLGATMPSVLVEAAFISNPREEKRLLSSTYRKHVAESIVSGVQHFSSAMDQVAKR